MSGKARGGGASGRKKFKDMFYKKSSKPLKKTKLSLVFDESSRVDFLTGFHKRKLERKNAQKLKLEKQVAAERKRIRAEAKKSVGKKLCSSDAILPEVEHLLNLSSTKLEPSESESQTITMGSKVVTISSLENIHTKLPPLKQEESDESDNEINENEANDASKAGGGNVKSMLKQATNRLLQSSKAYKTSMKMKQKNKRSRRNPNFVAKRDRNAKGDDSKGSKKSSGGVNPGSGKRQGKKKKGKN